MIQKCVQRKRDEQRQGIHKQGACWTDAEQLQRQRAGRLHQRESSDQAALILHTNDLRKENRLRYERANNIIVASEVHHHEATVRHTGVGIWEMGLKPECMGDL